jgi:hypothetical protein
VVEVWKPIKNYPGYEVSNFGRVRTHNKTSFTKKHGIRHWKDRILKLRGTSPCGSRIMLWNEKGMREFLVARLTAFTFFNEDINNQKLTVNHKDGNRFNNNLENLELVSLKENIQHGFRTGLYKSTQIKVKITNKITGAVIYPSSLSEGSSMIEKNVGYISGKIKQNKFENEIYRWELL